jgi:uncharacterized repeat protein (TIGR03847 family)
MSREAPVARFVPGFVGVPGDRTFYFEVEIGPHGQTAWYLAEKTQVAAFAAQAALLLAELGFTGAGANLDVEPLRAPASVAFRVAELTIAYLEEPGLIEIGFGPVEDEAAPVAHSVTPAQLDAAVRIGVTAVDAGRPACPKCGLAMDPDGHVCPTTNGDLRGHRP